GRVLGGDRREARDSLGRRRKPPMTRERESDAVLRILVAGGAGCIGSHLCRRLHAEGHDVIALDSLITGSRENVRELLGSPRFTLIERDAVRGFTEVVRGRIDRVYNLACPASPVHYQMDPIHTTLTSVLGTLNCLRLAERWGARCLLTSTSE